MAYWECRALKSSARCQKFGVPCLFFTACKWCFNLSNMSWPSLTTQYCSSLYLCSHCACVVSRNRFLSHRIDEKRIEKLARKQILRWLTHKAKIFWEWEYLKIDMDLKGVRRARSPWTFLNPYKILLVGVKKQKISKRTIFNALFICVFLLLYSMF